MLGVTATCEGRSVRYLRRVIETFVIWPRVAVEPRPILCVKFSLDRVGWWPRQVLRRIEGINCFSLEVVFLDRVLRRAECRGKHCDHRERFFFRQGCGQRQRRRQCCPCEGTLEGSRDFRTRRSVLSVHTSPAFDGWIEREVGYLPSCPMTAQNSLRGASGWSIGSFDAFGGDPSRVDRVMTNQVGSLASTNGF